MSGITTLPFTFGINGVISTDKSVLQNLEAICSAAGAFLNYDSNQGKWSVIINELETESIASFDNTNIIGAMQVSGRGLNELYNSVTVTFPNFDLVDEPESLTFNVPEELLFEGEPKNNLNISYDLVSEPVQATILALLELRQSRIDKTISFTTDFSQTGLRAGDIIDVTNDDFGWTQKMFRIMSISDGDAEDGSIAINISALEYDASIYDFSDITRLTQEGATGIIGIGIVPAPGTPVLNVFQQDTRPRIVVTSTVPTGIVNAMELWISADGTGFYMAQRLNAINGVYATGYIATFDHDKDIPANVYVKTRAVNGTTTSPFSAVTSHLGFVATQVTQAAKQDSPLVDSLGNLLPALALSKVAGWAMGKSPTYASSGGILDQLGLTTSNFTTATGAPANAPGMSVLSHTLSGGGVSSNVNNVAGTATLAGFTGSSSPVASFNWNYSFSGQAIQIICAGLGGTMDYEYIDGATNSVLTHTGVIMYFPCLIGVRLNGNPVFSTTMDWQTPNTSIVLTPGQVGGSLAGNWSVEYIIIPTYDLNMNNTVFGGPSIFPFNYTATQDITLASILYQ